MKLFPNPGPLFLLSLGLLPLVTPAADWPQWRGPTRDGQVSGTHWPSSLKGDVLKQLWRVELAPSYSGPIIVSNFVFTTETKDKRVEIVRAFDRSSGKELWQTDWEGAISVPFFAKANGDWIRSTPACDGQRLYVAGIRDVLVCLDVNKGKELWRYDFVKELKTPPPSFGFVCSPLLDDGHVYVQAGASFAKLEAKTGQLVWRTLTDGGGMYGSAFSSPAMATLDGARQLLVQSRTKIAGVSPADGTVLWSQPTQATQGMNILTPVVYSNIVFTSTYGGKTIGFRVQRADGLWQVEPAWTHKAQGYMTTPVVVAGVAYTHLRSQRAMAIDLLTGKELWTTTESFGKYWSLVAQGKRILALDERGTLYLFNAEPEKFDLLDSRQVSEADSWAHLAVCGNELFVRELNALVAYRWRIPSP